mgnify:CR=1 FL=1
MDAALRSLLDWYAAVGIDVPPVPDARPPRKKRVVTTSRDPQKTVAAVPRAETKPPAPSSAAPIVAKCKTLDALQSAMLEFNAGALSDGARQAVFARGNPAADLMVIGEAPGRDEDISGKPFAGRSGELLDRMLGAIGLGAEDAYLSYVVNWRPKGSRPSDADIALCRPFLNRHITLAAPKAILLVGGTAMNTLTGQSSMMKNRGQWAEVTIDGQVYPTLPIYDPEFLLKNPELKKDAWRDLLTLREKLLSLP